MDDPLKQLLDELANPPGKTAERARKNHSVYLDTALFKEFKQTCAAQGHSASEVLNKLIAMYLAAVRPD